MTTDEFQIQLNFLLRGFGDNLRNYVVLRIMDSIKSYMVNEIVTLEALEHAVQRICTTYLFSSSCSTLLDVLELVDAFVEEQTVYER